MSLLKNIVLSLIGLITPLVSLAQSGSIDKKIDQYMGPVTKIIEDIIFFTVPVGFGYEVPFVLIWLLVGAVFFTIYFNFISIISFFGDAGFSGSPLGKADPFLFLA